MRRRAAAFAEANKAGGVKGRKLEPISKDNGYEPPRHRFGRRPPAGGPVAEELTGRPERAQTGAGAGVDPRPRPIVDRKRLQPFFAINDFTSSIASVKRWLRSDKASVLDFWMRSATSRMLPTARS